MKQGSFKPAISLVDYVELIKQWRRPKRVPADFPRKLKQRLVALHYLLIGLDAGVVYSEEEVNLAIRQRNPFAIDHVQLRRILIEHRMLERTPDGGEYRTSDGYRQFADWDSAVVEPSPVA